MRYNRILFVLTLSCLEEKGLGNAISYYYYIYLKLLADLEASIP